ncbi:MAG TPA: hypothetical protein VMH23_03995, partial [Bacteroidota bacterium]|nr:hypothetical protein [Bacteroidota bacterium]
MIRSMHVLCLLLAGGFVAQQLDAQGTGFNGLTTGLGNLSRLSKAKTRSISAENFSGEKGEGGKSSSGTGEKAARDLGKGWKISPSVKIEKKSTFTLAEIDGPGALQHIWMTPTGTWRYTILRIYWDGEKDPSVE